MSIHMYAGGERAELLERDEFGAYLVSAKGSGMKYACFANLELVCRLDLPKQFLRITVSVENENGWVGMTPGFSSTLLRYAEWLTTVFRVPIHLVRHQEQREKVPRYMYEVGWEQDTPTDQLFVTLCFVRFITKEFAGHIKDIQETRTPKELLADIFTVSRLEHPAHMPFNDAGWLFDHMRDDQSLPELGPEFGKALHDFAVDVLHERQWQGIAVAHKLGLTNSMVSARELFHPYYKVWKGVSA